MKPKRDRCVGGVIRIAVPDTDNPFEAVAAALESQAGYTRAVLPGMVNRQGEISGKVVTFGFPSKRQCFLPFTWTKHVPSASQGIKLYPRFHLFIKSANACESEDGAYLLIRIQLHEDLVPHSSNRRLGNTRREVARLISLFPTNPEPS